jgi:hypothetical protein
MERVRSESAGTPKTETASAGLVTCTGTFSEPLGAAPIMAMFPVGRITGENKSATGFTRMYRTAIEILLSVSVEFLL